MQARDTAWTQGLRAGPGYNTKAITPSTCACARVELCLGNIKAKLGLTTKSQKCAFGWGQTTTFTFVIHLWFSQMDHSDHKSVHLAETKPPLSHLWSIPEHRKLNTTITKVCVWLRPNHHFHICDPSQSITSWTQRSQKCAFGWGQTTTFRFVIFTNGTQRSQKGAFGWGQTTTFRFVFQHKWYSCSAVSSHVLGRKTKTHAWVEKLRLRPPHLL